MALFGAYLLDIFDPSNILLVHFNVVGLSNPLIVNKSKTWRAVTGVDP